MYCASSLLHRVSVERSDRLPPLDCSRFSTGSLLRDRVDRVAATGSVLSTFVTGWSRLCWARAAAADESTALEVMLGERMVSNGSGDSRAPGCKSARCACLTMPLLPLTRGSASSAEDAGVWAGEDEAEEEEDEARRRAEGRGCDGFKGGGGSVASGFSRVVVVSRQSGELLRRREGRFLGASEFFNAGASLPSLSPSEWSWSSVARPEPRSEDRDSRAIAQWAEGSVAGHAGAQHGESKELINGRRVR